MKIAWISIVLTTSHYYQAVPLQDEDERNLHSDYRRKSIRIPPAKSMRDVLSQLLAKKGYAQVQSAASCDA